MRCRSGLIVAALSLALAACGPGDGTAPRTTVVVYSPHGKEILEPYEERFEAAHPGIDVQWLDMGAQEVYSRIKQEAERPAADIWWGGPSPMFIQAAGEGLLSAYRPTWAEAVPPRHHDAGDRWYGTYRSPLVIVYNTRGMTLQEAPQTWDELLEPEWADRIVIREPLASGTMRTFIGAMILREGGVAPGVQWLRRLHHNTVAYAPSPRLLFERLKRHPDWVSVWLQPDIFLQRELNGYPFGMVAPPETPVMTEAIAIVSGAPHPESAKLFYEFVTSEEALLHQARVFGKIPARDDIPQEDLPEWMVALHIEALDIDWIEFAEHEQEWVARWEEDVYNAP